MTFGKTMNKIIFYKNGVQFVIKILHFVALHAPGRKRTSFEIVHDHIKSPSSPHAEVISSQDHHRRRSMVLSASLGEQYFGDPRVGRQCDPRKYAHAVSSRGHGWGRRVDGGRAQRALRSR